MIQFPERQPFSLYLERDVNKMVKERAGFKCEKCGEVGACGLIVAHHIFPIYDLPRPFNLFNHPSNRQALCPSCHARVHRLGRWGVGNPGNRGNSPC